MQQTVGWSFLVLLVFPGTLAILNFDVPSDLLHCYTSFTNLTTDDNIGEPIHVHCLQEFLLKKDIVPWHEFDMTQKDFDLLNTLTRSMVHREKRQATGFNPHRRPQRFPPSNPGYPGGPRGPGGPGGPGGPALPGGPRNPFPGTGFRRRKEYRTLSNRQRAQFHRALNTLKTRGQYDTFANLHRGIVVMSAHQGPNFLGWHRVYLALFEEALRAVNYRMFLPYWDSTLDDELENPELSIIWTARFLGNGNGRVTSGPFANWNTSIGPLTRSIPGFSRLISKADINRVLTKCRTREITVPTADFEYNLEYIHGGPHVWVGGQMAGLNTAAHDPVFFLHHSFIDYIWERFRKRQASAACNSTNPAQDYPQTTGLHNRRNVMDGFPNYRNIHGYAAYWTVSWYAYARSPTCSRYNQSCRSRYLTCNSQYNCESTTVPATERMRMQSFAGSQAGQAARMEVSRLNIGQTFRAPPPRTRAG